MGRPTLAAVTVVARRDGDNQERDAMDIAPLGIHHVTAVASDPQGNVDFYARTLGLRLVKQTVNFDAPDTYHLYYGDESGNPGTILTFFPWPDAPRGRRGTGQAVVTSFAVPEGSLGWWHRHLQAQGVELAQEPRTRSQEDALSFYDPDGLVVELVAGPGPADSSPWTGSAVPAAHAVRGLAGVTLSEVGHQATAGLLDRLGFHLVEEEAERVRFEVGGGGPGSRVDVLAQPGAPRGLVAAGTVHHVAWRAPDEPVEADWREQLVDSGIDVTPIIDRRYFRSIYFREPGGVLLEIATDPPGFTADEPLLELGRALRLPPWLEPSREQIEAALPALKLPEAP